MIEDIKTDNDNLNVIIETYFIPVSGIEEPKIGVYSYKDIADNFKFSLREYSITHSHKCEPWDNKTLEELLVLNQITEEDYNTMVEKIDTYLIENHTDSQWSGTKQKASLYKQIDTFLCEIDYENFTETNKIYSILHDEDEFEVKKNRYLNSVLKAMKVAEVNQVKENKYLVIEKFLDTYKSYIAYMINLEFSEKKKVLLKLRPKHKDTTEESQDKLDKQIKALQRYINEIYDDNPDYIKYIQWFITYLIYDSHVMHVMMIHMPLGYKTEEIRKLYIKLFRKDKSTGKKDNFLYHSDFSGITKERLYETDKCMYKLTNSKKNRNAINKLAKKDSNWTYKITPFTLYVTKEITSQDKFIYSDIINSLNYHN